MAGAAVISCAALLLASAAGAAMTVGSTGDSGGCSLRAVIEAVEAGTSNGCGSVESPTTTINVPDNTITLSSQLVVKHGSMTIVGSEDSPSQSVIHGGGDRVIEVQASANVKIVGFKITGGHTANGGLAPGPYTENIVGNGGGILNKGILVLEHVVVTENHTGNGDTGVNGGLEQSGGAGGRGGSGGGIFNDIGANLVVIESTISKNFTGDGGRGGDGGAGLNAFGHYPNGGDGGNGGASGSGGGIYNAGSLTIEGSTVSGNFTGHGGEGGTGHQGTGEATDEGHELSPGDGGDGGEGGNSGWHNSMYSGYTEETYAGGGGIFNVGTLTISNSTISGNSTGAGGTGGPSGPGGGPNKYGYFADSGRAGFAGGAGRGGGLFTGAGYRGHSPASLTNVTIYGNRTGDGGVGGAGSGGADSSLGGAVGGFGGDGGGIWADGYESGSELTLVHVTIAGNEVGAGGPGGYSPSSYKPEPGPRGVGAGIATGARDAGTGAGVSEKNSIIADNGSTDPKFADANCYQRSTTYTDIENQGGNVSWNDNTCPGTVADTKLGPFADNGGLTKTLMPALGSSAINAVLLANCTVHVDQRGEPRPGTSKANCDAGAVETQPGGPPPRKLTVGKAGNGSVTSSPAGIDCGVTCTANFDNDTEVTLTASAASGSTFAGWSGECSGTGTCQVTMSQARSVTATFNGPPRTLTVSKAGSGSGTVTSSPAGIDCGATCSHDFAENTLLTLTASPASGSTFAGWSGACSGTGTCQVTMNQAQAVTATFQVASSGGSGGSGTPSTPGGGSGTPAGPPPPPPTPPVSKPPKKCGKGFVKKVVKGKARCVKKKKRHRHRHP